MGKWIKTAELRDLDILYAKEEISYSRMVEMLNEIVDNKSIDRPLDVTAKLRRISYERLLGEFIGTLEGICANEITQELKDKLKLKIEWLKKIP